LVNLFAAELILQSHFATAFLLWFELRQQGSCLFILSARQRAARGGGGLSGFWNEWKTRIEPGKAKFTASLLTTCRSEFAWPSPAPDWRVQMRVISALQNLHHPYTAQKTANLTHPAHAEARVANPLK
jgi:hypothetical protein